MERETKKNSFDFYFRFCSWILSLSLACAELVQLELKKVLKLMRRSKNWWNFEFAPLKMVYTSSNVRAMSKSHQMTSKQSASEKTAAAAKNRSQTTNMHLNERRNVSLPQEQHPVAQNSRQKAQPQHQQYYQYHQQLYFGMAGQRHDGNGSRQLMSLPAKAPIDADNIHRYSKSMGASDVNGSADSSCVDEYSSDDDHHYNSNRSILNHHNCQPTDDIYMDALSEVRIESERIKFVQTR